MKYSLPYGKEKIQFNIPENFSINVIKPKPFSIIENFYEKTYNALENPTNSLPLSDLIKEKKSACIVVTDNTRQCPDKELLVPILQILESQIKKENISIVIASGMHKKMSYAEKIEKYGKEICENYKIFDHDAKDNDILENLGTTKIGNPIKISKIAANSDFLISLGVVEPHQFAGYSGGYKTVSIGLADDATISRMHSTKIIKNSNIKVGQIDSNPIRDEIEEIGKKIGLNFIVNVILGESNELLAIEAGDPIVVHKNLIKRLKIIYEILLKKTYDVVICGIGHPKDSNLYQASRAASYLYFSNVPIVNEGGYIVIPAPCNEGAGLGIGEQRFFSMLKNNSIDEILTTNIEFKAGEQRSYFIAQVLKHCKIVIVGCKTPEIIKEAKMIPAKDMTEAFQLIQNDFNSTEILLIPNVFSILPKIK